MGFTCGWVGKESSFNAGDLGSIPGLGKSPGEGKGYPLQYSGLENSMDSIVHGVTKSQTRLSDFTFFHPCLLAYILYRRLEKESESRSVTSDSLQAHGLYNPWNSPGQNTGVGSLSLLQQISPTQKSNRGLLHCRLILYQLSYQGSPVLALLFSK